mgnify:FL=1
MSNSDTFPKTNESFFLNKEEVRRFSQDGYLLLSSFFTNKQIESCLDKVRKYIDETVPLIPSEETFYEVKNDHTTLKQLQRMHIHEPWFDILFNGKTKQLAETLLDGEVITKNLQYFNKPPKIGKATPPHQDGYYFKLTPPKALTMWLALDDVDENNGCVRYVKGSHLKGMRDHSMTGTLGFSQGISSYGNDDDIKNEIPISAKKGDLIVHDSMTIHRADQNLSDSKNRRALGFIFYSADSEEDNLSLKKYKTELKDQQRGKI